VRKKKSFSAPLSTSRFEKIGSAIADDRRDADRSQLLRPAAFLGPGRRSVHVEPLVDQSKADLEAGFAGGGGDEDSVAAAATVAAHGLPSSLSFCLP